ncbi:T9SS type A sorting domain-containing protein [bacterium]|nr:T9SS type A sorting domain-containing protein [bacterium]
MARATGIIIIIILLCGSLCAQELSGPLSGTYGPGVYTIVGDLSVAAGDSATLLAGTTFLFQGNNNFSLDIDGYFTALGTEADSIYFLPDELASTWTGIDFNGNSDHGCRLEYCYISGSTASGVDCFGSSPVIDHCSIVDNHANFGGGLYATSGAEPVITNCLVSGNSTNVCGAGIWASSANPMIDNCIFDGNNAGNSAGGIYCYSADAVITNCIITNNTSYAGAGGIFCRNVTPYIYNCIITDNSTQTVGGGINMNNTSPTVERCLIARNSAGISGGGIEAYISTPTIINCTIADNYAAEMGGGIESFDSTPIIRNTIISGNEGYGGLYFFNSQNADVSYCDFYDNEAGNLAGTIPPGLGQMVMTNANGDSCDLYYNMMEDPLFYSFSGDSAYYLTEDSPCIDAGDPASPLDPDNTIADIGMFYYPQESTSPVAVTLNPYGAPIQIPAAGGSFDFNIALDNTSGSSVTCDAWIMVTLPGGSQYGPLLGPVSVTLNAGMLIDRDRTQVVPAVSDPGEYIYQAFVGNYPDDIWDTDSFSFEKLDGLYGSVINSWQNFGEEFTSAADIYASKATLHRAQLMAYPNPFNPETRLVFTLPEAEQVSLTVFDVSGRVVTTLYNGLYQAGTYEATFGASHLPSGIYFTKLSAGDFTQTQKLMLVK